MAGRQQIVFGHNSVAEIMRQLPAVLQKKYLRQLVTKRTALVRKDARKLAPKGTRKRGGTTKLQSAKEQARHLPLRKNIRSLKTRTNRRTGVISNKVAGPPQAGPLIAGHKLVAWGRPTSKTVKPANPNFMEEARKSNALAFFVDGQKSIEVFIKKDVARLGKKQTEGALKEGGVAAKRLGILQRAGF